MTPSVWSGVYARYEEAQASLGAQPSRVFELDAWLLRQRSLADRAVDLLRDGCQAPRPSFLPALVAQNPKVFIVDLGGGSEWVYALLKGLGMTPQRYVVLDLPQVIQFYRVNPVNGVEYQYLDDTTLGADQSVDLLYANSSVQYMPDNAGLVDHISRLRPRTVLIDELLWSRGDQDWFTIQRNSDIASVSRFASLHRIMAELEQVGMKLVWKGAFGAGHVGYKFPSMSNFSDELAIDNAMSLVFARDFGC